MKMVMDDGINIYLSKPYIKKIDINDRETIKKIINKIRKKYDIDIYGYVDVKIFIDENYGIIIKIKKDTLEYFDYFKDDIEMDIEIIKDTFLYKIDDASVIKQTENTEIYKQYENIYIKVKNNDDINIGKIIENSEIIYGKTAKKIIENNNKISLEVI